MRKRLVAIYVVASLCFGLTMTFVAQAAGKGRVKGRLAPRASSRKQVFQVVQLRPRFALTTEQVREKASQDFANLPDVGTSIKATSPLSGIDPRIQATVANLINAAPVPPSRLQHVACLKDQPVGLKGWDGAIESIRPIPGGRSTTVVLMPIVDQQGVGRQVFTCTWIREKFTFGGSAIQLVDSSLDPNSHPTIVID